MKPVLNIQSDTGPCDNISIVILVTQTKHLAMNRRLCLTVERRARGRTVRPHTEMSYCHTVVFSEPFKVSKWHKHIDQGEQRGQMYEQKNPTNKQRNILMTRNIRQGKVQLRSSAQEWVKCGGCFDFGLFFLQCPSWGGGANTRGLTNPWQQLQEVSDSLSC